MNRSPVLKYTLMLLLGLTSWWLKAFTPLPPSPLISTAIIDTTICVGECVVFDNTSYCEEGFFSLENNLMLKLNLAPTVQQTSFTICEGETFPGRDWATPGRYNYQTKMGACAITVWVDLKVEQPKETHIVQAIQYGECYDFGANTLCQTGEYELIYTAANGCDSTVYIDLIVEELLIDTLPPVVICAGNSYTVMGIDTTLTTSGLYKFYGTTSTGRPTLTILDFRVNAEIYTHLEEMICANTSFIHNGLGYDQAGRYEFRYTSVDGCDSIVVLDLTVNPVITTSLTKSITSDQFMVIGNNVVNLQGSYEFVFQSELGCDSIVQLFLTIEGAPEPWELVDDAVAADICSGNLSRILCSEDLPFTLGQNTFYQGGTFNLSYVPPDGCVTDLTLDLTVELNTVFFVEKICQGESYIMNNVAYTQSGVYRDTVFSATNNSCDSIFILDLLVMPTKNTTIDKTICWGDPFIIDGQPITESGDYTLVYKTDYGCDSLVKIQLTIEGGPNPEMEQLTLCAGENYSDGAGNQVFVSGQYNFRFVNQAGCDSIVNLNLLIPDTIRNKVDTFFCDGESFQFENFSVTRPGLYRERFTSVMGCDSLVEYNLTSLDCEISSVQDADTIICGGNTGEFSFTLIKGQAPFTYEWSAKSGGWAGAGENLNLQEEVIEEGLPSGEYNITVTDRNGKEAILEVVIFRPEIITAEWILPPLLGGTHLACSDDIGAFLEIAPAGGLPPYRYQWSNGTSNSNRINDLTAGTYAVTITDDFNCPFIINQEITAPPKLIIDAISENSSCEDQASGQINILGSIGGTAPYEYQLEGHSEVSNTTNFKQLAAGEYLINAFDVNGCHTDTTLYITAPEILSLDYDSDISIKLGNTYELEVFSSGNPKIIIWDAAEGLSCDDCLEVLLNPVNSSTYTLTVTSEDDCITAIDLNVIVLKDRYVFIPNVFSPNLDGLNDQFTIFGNQAIANVELFQVYARSGELVFESHDLEINDEFKGWDGYYRGEKMNPGVYLWQAKINFIDGESFMYSGDVTLIE